MTRVESELSKGDEVASHLLAKTAGKRTTMKNGTKEVDADEEIENSRMERNSEPNGQKIRQFFLSFAVIIGVAISWALAVQFRKSTLAIDPRHFYAPFTMVWFSTTFMSICYPVFLLYTFGVGKKSGREHHEDALLILAPRKKIEFWYFVCKPMLFLALWTAINYSYAQSLGRISAGAASSIMSANAGAVCVLGWFLLKERFSMFKFVAVVLAIGGMVIVSMDSEFAGDPLGIGLAIVSTLFAALYKVLFKLFNGNASLGQISLFMSVLGLSNVVLNAFVASILLYFDVDHIEWDHITWLPLIGSALLGLLFNFLVNFGIVLLDPLVISIGMVFGMPLSACIDVLFRSMPISVVFLLGSAMITLSFVLIAFPVEIGLRKIFCSVDNEIAEERMAEREKSREDSPLRKID